MRIIELRSLLHDMVEVRRVRRSGTLLVVLVSACAAELAAFEAKHGETSEITLFEHENLRSS